MKKLQLPFWRYVQNTRYNIDDRTDKAFQKYNFNRIKRTLFI